MLPARRNVEGVGLHFALNLRVSLNDDGERLRLDRSKGVGIQIRLIPKTVAIASALKLIFNDGPESFADLCPRDMILGQATDPEIDIVWSCIGRSKSRLNVNVGRYICKGRFRSQTI